MWLKQFFHVWAALLYNFFQIYFTFHWIFQIKMFGKLWTPPSFFVHLPSEGAYLRMFLSEFFLPSWCTQQTVTYSKSVTETLEKRCWICSKFTSSWVSVTEIFHKALVNTNYGKLTRINFKSTHSSQAELSQNRDFAMTSEKC